MVFKSWTELKNSPLSSSRIPTTPPTRLAENQRPGPYDRGTLSLLVVQIILGGTLCFQPKGWEKTYAEMTKEEKNSLSHRYKALDKLRSWLESLDAEQGDIS